MTERERPSFEWLRERIESASREVAAWPDWKRNASTLARAAVDGEEQKR